MRPGRREGHLLAIILGLLLAAGLRAAAAGPAFGAQAQGAGTGSAATVAGNAHIAADSPPYHITWDGTVGTLHQDALGAEPAQSLALTYLRAEPGPAGHSHYLVWFLARDTNRFALLWCYLDEAGSDFWCWLYRYPANLLTTQHFTGNYRFTPPAQPPAPAPATLQLPPAPRYLGPDFTYRDWTRNAGRLDHLDLRAASTSTGQPTPGNPENADTATSGPVVQTLTGLRVTPLHAIHVGAGNGWRQGGWGELHALAYDSTGAPYYLILYSNSTRGFAVDLRNAQVYIADYGQRVGFAGDMTTFGAPDTLFEEPTEMNVRRNERHDFTLFSTHTYANPFLDVSLEVDFYTPTGQRMLVTGFWDGGDTWRFRFTPTLLGIWRWRTRSTDPDLNAQEGTFTCTAEDTANKGFVRVRKEDIYRHQFGYEDGTPFLPDPIRDALDGVASGDPSIPAAVGAGTGAGADESPAFLAFRKRIDGYAALGFNRLMGGYLLGKPAPVNEGGAPFLNGDPDHPNPAYFQALDRRIAYCNMKGIIPDLGLGAPELLTTLDEAQLRGLWRYIVARYAAYNVCWNLFQSEPDSASLDATERLAGLADLTHRYDPFQHPLTTIASGNVALPSLPSGSDENAANDPSLPDDEGMRELLANRKPRKTDPYAGFAGTSFAAAPWLDVITLDGGDLNVVSADWRFEKPLVVLDENPVSADSARKRMWETRLRGGYWVATADANAPNSPVLQAAAACNRFFQQTHYWRLMPHTQANSGPASEGQTPPAPQSQPGVNGAPILLMEDTAWEYVVYFEAGGSINLDLLEATGPIKISWFDPRSGQFTRQQSRMGGAFLLFAPPDDRDWVLYVSRR
ncbi:MAG TPA: DUF5060 domain-containing protein [Chthonomonadaceae bacterium]|nr:DUF5060 domain-containing protein [Chthonomonadaceae bacterium]